MKLEPTMMRVLNLVASAPCKDMIAILELILGDKLSFVREFDHCHRRQTSLRGTDAYYDDLVLIDRPETRDQLVMTCTPSGKKYMQR